MDEARKTVSWFRGVIKGAFVLATKPASLHVIIVKERIVDLVLGDIQSRFLCPNCGELLYRFPQGDAGRCLNASCTQWPSDLSEVVDPSEAGEPRVYKEIDEEGKSIREMIRLCNAADLRRFAYDQRMASARSWIEDGMLPNVDRFLAVGELLILTQGLDTTRHHTSGATDRQTFSRVLDRVEAWSRHQRFLEDLRTGRYRLGRRNVGALDDKRPFLIKYSEAMREAQLAIGLASSPVDVHSDLLFRYSNIGEQATPKAPAASVDFADTFDELWPLTVQLGQGLNSHYRVA